MYFIILIIARRTFLGNHPLKEPPAIIIIHSQYLIDMRTKLRRILITLCGRLQIILALGYLRKCLGMLKDDLHTCNIYNIPHKTSVDDRTISDFKKCFEFYNNIIIIIRSIYIYINPLVK